MKNLGLVSVIVPTFNAEETIRETIECILNQTYPYFEIIITDDFSNDKTTSIIKSFQDTRICLIELNENCGAGLARNTSIQRANGKYISFCDSDDLWHPDKLIKQIEFMLKYNLSFTYSNYQIIDESGRFLKIVKSPSNLTYDLILRNCYIGCLTVIYDADKLGLLFFDKIKKRQDWILWIKIFQVISSTKGIDEVLASYRIRTNSISSNKITLLKYNWMVYYKFLNFNKIVATYMFIRFLFFYFLFKKFGIYRLWK